MALALSACNKSDVERPVQQNLNNPQALVASGGTAGYAEDDSFHASIHPEVRDFFNDSTTNGIPVKGCYKPDLEGTGLDICPGNACECGTIIIGAGGGFKPICDCSCCAGSAAGAAAEDYGYHLDWPAAYHDAVVWNTPSGPSYDQGKAINKSYNSGGDLVGFDLVTPTNDTTRIDWSSGVMTKSYIAGP